MHLSDFGLLTRHGTLWLMAATLAERLGLPFFVTPLIVAGGALAAMGQMSFGTLLLGATVACLAGDAVWYELGRWKGNALFGLLCRISLKPESCVRRSRLALEKHTGRTLLWAKWVPGVAHLALPLAGAARMPRTRFHVYNAIGSVLWLGALLAGGYLSMRTIDWLGLFRVTAPWAVGAALLVSVAMVAHSYLERRKFLRAMRLARISPEELKAKMEAGEAPVVVDLRHPLDFLTAPRTVPGAVRMNSGEIGTRWKELPQGREIVVYCTCPNEETAVKVARELEEQGVGAVRPLLGGLAGWERAGFSVEEHFDERGHPLAGLEASGA